MKLNRKSGLYLVVVVSMIVAPSIGLLAFKEEEGQSSLDLLQFVSPSLEIFENAAPIDSFRSVAGTPEFPGGSLRIAAWDQFLQENGSRWIMRLDRRTGLPALCEGSGKPWIPGAGNSLKLEDISTYLNASSEIDVPSLERMARDFMASNPDLFPKDQGELVLNETVSGEYGGYLASVRFDYYHGGVPVEGAYVFFRVNNGNLVQFGCEMVASVPFDPIPAFDAATAQSFVWGYIGGFLQGDKLHEPGRLVIVPTRAESEGGLYLGTVGEGVRYRLAYVLVMNRPGVSGTWEARLDAKTGEMLSFRDTNLYGTVKGGVYQLSNEDPEVERPFAGMEVTNGETVHVTDNAGHYNYLGGEAAATFINGEGVTSTAITDWCDDDGTPFYLASSSPPGDLSFGMGPAGATDCATPPSSSGPGNTHAARTTFYHVDKVQRLARRWLPSISWLNQTLDTWVNIGNRCNAYYVWTEDRLEFYQSVSGGCSNTGELAPIIAHEFGHGLDWNDGTPPSSFLQQFGEAYGDVMAFMYTHESCLGRNFHPGVPCTWPPCDPCPPKPQCTNCTGLREADWRKIEHLSLDPGEPPYFMAHTPFNYTREYCFGFLEYDSRYCSRGDGHCAAAPMVEAVWDLAAEDLPRMGIDAATAWTIAERLWFLSRPSAHLAYRCPLGTYDTTFTTDGCNDDSWFSTFRSVDDDNGNLDDGTPHGAAIYAAFARHNLACSDKPHNNSGCGAATVPGQPSLAATASSRKVQLSWNDVSNAVSYSVLRNESGPDTSYTTLKSGLTATSYTDFEVANGVTYNYRVQAVGAKPACPGPVSSAKSVMPSGGTYAISGTITELGIGGAPLAGFFVSARDSSPHQWAWGYSASDGQYGLYDIPNGAYTVRPVKRCYKFFPPYASLTVSGAPRIGVDFQGIRSSLCTQCFDAYFADSASCSKGNFQDQEKCFATARTVLETCLANAARADDSPLDGAILLSVITARSKGQPVPEAWPFTVMEAGDYFVNVVNGDQYYTETKVSSAVIDLAPGGRVLSPNDLNKDVNLVVKPVHLEPGEYVLNVEVRSQPGSYLTVVISDRDFSQFEALP